MSRDALRSRRAATAPLALLLALLLAAGAPCAHRADRASPEAGAAEGGRVRPPDGRWLVDDRGREYYVARLPRAQAARVGPGDVRSFWGIRLDVVSEDAEFYHYKVYRPAEAPAPTDGAPGDEDAPPPERRREVRERHRVELRESRRLELVPFGAGLPAGGQWRDSFAVADMNGDGRPDIAHGPARKAPGRPAIFLGDGAGGWARWREASWPALPYDYGSAAAGDLNADGAADLVLGVHLAGVLVLVGDGRGVFRAWGEGVDFAPGGGAFSTRAVALADADGDGRPDVVALGEGPRPGGRGAPLAPATGLLLYRNRGDGTWERDGASAGAGRLFGSAIAAGDFDGDGRTDFATGSGVLGRAEVLNLARAGGGWEAVAAAGLRPAAIVRSVAAADFDGDGRSDLLVAYQSREGGAWRTGADVILGPAGPDGRVVPLASSEDLEGAAAVGAGDVDGDGKPDAVVATDRGELVLFPGDGAGGFVRERASTGPFGGGCRATHVALADVDGDGADEVLASFALEDAADEEGGAPRCPSGGGLGAWKVRRRR